MISKIGKIEVICREDEMYNATDFLEKWNIENPNKIKLIGDYFKYSVTDDFLEIIKNDNSFFLEIPPYIKEKKSVSEMARLLNVSRSSLKDYIESRELKQVAFGSLLPQAPQDAEAQVINTIVCPNINIQ